MIEASVVINGYEKAPTKIKEELIAFISRIMPFLLGGGLDILVRVPAPDWLYSWECEVDGTKRTFRLTIAE